MYENQMHSLKDTHHSHALEVKLTGSLTPLLMAGQYSAALREKQLGDEYLGPNIHNVEAGQCALGSILLARVHSRRPNGLSATSW
jgi:hypothetical protein